MFATDPIVGAQFPIVGARFPRPYESIMCRILFLNWYYSGFRLGAIQI